MPGDLHPDPQSPVSELELAVYTPEAALRSPGQLLGSMWHDLRAGRELGWRLFVANVSAQYRQSLLGVLWAFLPPILTGLVFIYLQSSNILDLGETSVPYPVFALVGTTYWQIFVDAVHAPMRSVGSSRAFLTKVNFPREALILSAAYFVGFNLVLRAIVLVAVMVWFQIPATTGLLLAPIAVVMLIVLGLTIGLLLTPIGMLYNDVNAALVAFMQLWFFATPVVYPPPEAFPLSLLATLNPVSPIILAARDLTTTGAVADPLPFLVVSALTFVGLAVAWVLYRVAAPVIIERMSA